MRILILHIALVFSIAAYSQQITQYSQFVHNYFAYNPAVAGSSKCYQLKLGFRSQWLGLNGHPNTGFGSFHTRLKLKKSTNFRAYHGVGAYIENDVLGYLGTTTINLAYAYHFPVSRDVMASVGIFAGLQQFKVDASKITTIDYSDPVLNNANSKFLIPYVTPGIFLNHDDWYVGFAIRQIVRNKWKKVIGVSARNRFHLNLIGGKRFRIADKFNLVPSVLIQYTGFSRPAINLNATIEFTNFFELGLSWRNQDAISAMVKLKFARYFTLGYAFDYTTSKLRTVSSNTHELIIGFSGCAHNTNNTYLCPVFD